MEYRDIEYTLVQTINPFGWKWSFEREGRLPKTGIAFDRAEAMHAVVREINRFLEEKRQ
jgi:hypothetical protein